jgi:hypothetical protein
VFCWGCVNFALNLLSSKLPAFGATTAVTNLSSLWLVTSRLQSYLFRVLPAINWFAGMARSYKFSKLNFARGRYDCFYARQT